MDERVGERRTVLVALAGALAGGAVAALSGCRAKSTLAAFDGGEAHVFPLVRQAGGSAGVGIDTLLAQHRRGRAITDYVRAVTRRPLDPALAEPLATTLEQFCLMYEEHTAREDTIVFPAWKRALTPAELARQDDLFEYIERRTFGTDGFEGLWRRSRPWSRRSGLLRPTSQRRPHR
jgi:hypothetical protein